MSPLPFLYGLLRMQCSVSMVGHRQKPSWCLAVSTMPRRAPALAAATIWSGSKSVGLNRLGSSSPYPHSLSVKVFREKWTKAYISRLCQASWRGLGTAPQGPGAPAFGEGLAQASTLTMAAEPPISIRRLSFRYPASRCIPYSLVIGIKIGGGRALNVPTGFCKRAGTTTAPAM